MTVAGHRYERVAEEIAHELGTMLAGELKDPRLDGGLTVTEVRVSPDLKQARIYISVIGDEAEKKRASAGLEAAAGFIRHELTERLQLRRMLELHFVLDRSEEYGRRIEELLGQVKKPPIA
jgi:ribosome-binding factor A